MKLSDNDFLLINPYNANKESEQVASLSTLCYLLDDITDLHCKNIILWGDFSIFFNLTLKSVRRAKWKFKNDKQILAKIVHIKESLGVSAIWGVRNEKKERHTFRQLHTTCFIERRLDYFLVSNNLQESINKMGILTAISTGHSPIFFLLSKNVDISRGKDLLKFNNSLCHKPDFVTELKNHLKVICNKMAVKQVTDPQLCWKYIKLEIKKFQKKKPKNHLPKLLH